MIEIIPAIDIIDGKCVRLSQGNYSSKKVYNENPLEIAKQYEDTGIKRLHLVDLDGAKSKRIVNYKTLESIAKNTSLIVDFGGGLKSNDDLKIAFSCGAQMITGGSIAVKDSNTFSEWLSLYGKEKIILGADVIDEKIAVTGWLENSGIDMWQFISDYKEKGITKVICTDISKDGMLQGPSTDLYVNMKNRFENLYIIASGGISCIKDVEILNKKGIDALIIGKAIYEGKISMKDLQAFI